MAAQCKVPSLLDDSEPICFEGNEYAAGFASKFLDSATSKMKKDGCLPIVLPTHACSIAVVDDCPFHCIDLATAYDLDKVCTMQRVQERWLVGDMDSSGNHAQLLGMILILHVVDRPNIRLVVFYACRAGAAAFVSQSRWIIRTKGRKSVATFLAGRVHQVQGAAQMLIYPGLPDELVPVAKSVSSNTTSLPSGALHILPKLVSPWPKIPDADLAQRLHAVLNDLWDTEWLSRVLDEAEANSNPVGSLTRSVQFLTSDSSASAKIEGLCFRMSPKLLLQSAVVALGSDNDCGNVGFLCKRNYIAEKESRSLRASPPPKAWSELETQLARLVEFCTFVAIGCTQPAKQPKRRQPRKKINPAPRYPLGANGEPMGTLEAVAELNDTEDIDEMDDQTSVQQNGTQQELEQPSQYEQVMEKTTLACGAVDSLPFEPNSLSLGVNLGECPTAVQPELMWLDNCIHVRNEKHASFVVCGGLRGLPYNYTVTFLPTSSVVQVGTANCGDHVEVDASRVGFGEFKVSCEFQDPNISDISANITKKLLTFEEERNWTVIAKVKNTFIDIEHLPSKSCAASWAPPFASWPPSPSGQFRECSLENSLFFLEQEGRWVSSSSDSSDSSSQLSFEHTAMVESVLDV